jgi:hypothetical protein
MTKIRIMSDDDGHTYFIPVGKERDFQKWLDAGPYWEGYDGEDFSGHCIGGSVEAYVFSNPEELAIG